MGRGRGAGGQGVVFYLAVLSYSPPSLLDIAGVLKSGLGRGGREPQTLSRGWEQVGQLREMH